MNSVAREMILRGLMEPGGVEMNDRSHTLQSTVSLVLLLVSNLGQAVTSY